MKRNLYVLVCIALLPATPALADDCASLETAIKAAPQQMSSLKQGRYDPSDSTAFNTSWRWGSATEDDCMITHDEDDGYDLACMIGSSSISEALDIGREMMSVVEGCLKDSGRHYKSTPLTESTAARGVHYRGEFLVEHSNKNDIRIGVSPGCRANYKGDERCSTHITVELVGDERP